ncbi:hypothetical protein [Chitinibacter sp. GC72]|uniref:hypothetical protein n=1 Tax=Chitinibacter sp. GC72 TaxID=1526917 RepID=UPI0012F85010|nr:hypothetical protein [Chitinibacter sp. GC72]
MLIEAQQKLAIQQLLRDRDDLAFRIEMALMSGQSRQLTLFLEDSEGLTFFQRHLLKDLRQLHQHAPREAASLQEQLLQGLPDGHQGAFDSQLKISQYPHLSSLAVR